MRTMFPSQEKNTKKKFQKPNILRKRSKKQVKLNTLDEDHHESPDKKSLTNKNCMKGINENEMELETIETLYSVAQSELEPSVETDLGNADYCISEASTSPNEDLRLDLKNTECLDESSAQIKPDESKIEDNTNHALVNIESFFNESAGEKYMLFDFDIEPGKQVETLVLIDNESPTSEMYIEQNSDEITSMVPLSAVTCQPQETNEEEVTNTSSFTNLYSAFTPPVKFKCDVANCGKEFRSEQKYKKHKNSHEEDGSLKAPRQVTVECPVKKVEGDGTDKSCGKIFLVRDQLLKHLNEEHTLDDAVYRCEECGRRFFWASGLRAHVRAHCRRAAGAGAGAGGAGAAGAEPGGLVCGWAGCGRVFRQPCRLREHARAHTGDRPYPCQYPNCGWSFRSASKLVRHARRHTGERRHACAACGRAFLRREHLRDHHARHHAPHARRARACTHPGCEQTFNNMSTLYLHMKKVHKKKEVEPPATATTETYYTVPDDMFMVSLAPEIEEAVIPAPAPDSPAYSSGRAAAEEAEVEVEAEIEAEAQAETEAEVEAEAEREWQSARTHCTWPLERAPRPDTVDDNLLKDDDQVEQSEGSESNTFTVRSDLFLHGNVLINEDSEHMGVVGGAGDSLGADLGLLDAHPTIDLMQEELMYADTAADESSFRIFLLSGEELT